MNDKPLHTKKPSDLWGVSNGPRAAHARSASARQRRRDKRAAKRARMPLKAYLRQKLHGDAFTDDTRGVQARLDWAARS